MKAGLMILLGSLFAASLSAQCCPSQNYPSSYGYYQNDPSMGYSGYESAPYYRDVNPNIPVRNSNVNAADSRGYFFENRNLNNVERQGAIGSNINNQNQNFNQNAQSINQYNQNVQNQPVSGYYWDNRNMRAVNNNARTTRIDRDQLPTTRNTYSPYGPLNARNL